ncbi:MAG: protein kinase [Acidobacteria bacterium]|nr:protein kinase [Acidobacteriota bacterium]
MSAIPPAIGRYQVLERLGRGGMGALFLARDPAIDRLVAIKVLRDDSRDIRERFAREARSAGRLHHPNIVTIFDVGEHEGIPFIAMEYIPGETLGQIIQRRAVIPLDDKLKMMEELCAGLAYAHRAGIVHRDVKPANLIVDAEGVLKILDFGIARVVNSSMTRIGTLVGTVNYMSPEQTAGMPADARSDVFAVGAVLYELLTYRQAFPGSLEDGVLQRIAQNDPPPLRLLAPQLAPIDPIVSRALAKEMSMRYQDMGAMRGEIGLVRRQLARGAAMDETAPVTPFLPVPPPQTPAPSSGTRRAAVDRELIAKRRAEQIDTLLGEARAKFEAEDFDGAIDACDRASLIDPDESRVIDMIDSARAAREARQLAALVAEARAALDRGEIDLALDAIARARAVNPEDPGLTAVVVDAEQARIRQERAQALAASLERARSSFDVGAFETAVQAAADALAIDPQCADARDLKQRASAAAEEERRRREADRHAAEAIAEARREFASGAHESALAMLQAFSPANEEVRRVLVELRNEAEAIWRRRLEEREKRRHEAQQAAGPAVPAPSTPAEEAGEPAVPAVAAEGAAAIEPPKPSGIATAVSASEPAAAPEEERATESPADVREAPAASMDEARAEVARQVAKAVAQAERALARHRFAEAMRSVTAALEKDPGDLRSLELRAEITRQREEAERRKKESRTGRGVVARPAGAPRQPEAAVSEPPPLVPGSAPASAGAPPDRSADPVASVPPPVAAQSPPPAGLAPPAPSPAAPPPSPGSGSQVRAASASGVAFATAMTRAAEVILRIDRWLAAGDPDTAERELIRARADLEAAGRLREAEQRIANAKVEAELPAPAQPVAPSPASVMPLGREGAPPASEQDKTVFARASSGAVTPVPVESHVGRAPAVQARVQPSIAERPGPLVEQAAEPGASFLEAEIGRWRSFDLRRWGALGLALLIVIGMWLFGGSAPDQQAPLTEEKAQAVPPSPQAAPPSAPATPPQPPTEPAVQSQAPSLQSQPVSSPEVANAPPPKDPRLAKIRADALQQFSKANYLQALTTVIAGLHLDPSDVQLRALMTRLADDARQRSDRAQSDANLAGAERLGVVSFENAARRRALAEQLRREGKLAESAQQFWSAAELFGVAAGEARRNSEQLSANRATPTQQAPSNVEPTAAPEPPPPKPSVEGTPAASTTVPAPSPSRETAPSPSRETAPVAQPAAAPPATPQSAAADEQGVRDALQLYKEAHERLSVTALKKIRPWMTEAQVQERSTYFSELIALRLQFENVTISITGDRATASCRIRYMLQNRRGGTTSQTVSQVLALQKVEGRWLIR